MGVVDNLYIQGDFTIADLATLLGYNSSHLGEVIANGNINKFARFKPVKYPSGNPISDAQRRSVGHGIIIPDLVSSATLTSDLIEDASANDWDYDRPGGGVSDPYRMADFRNENSPTTGPGYNKDAVPPIQCNYPRNGWTFARGSSARSLVIYFDLDPADSTDNLQATDFTEVLNLNEWKLIAYIEDIGIFECDDFILDDGEIAGTAIYCNIPSGTGSYTKDVFVCMHRYNDADGRHECIPLPKQGDFNPSTMTLNIVDDAEASGGGLSGGDTEEMFNNVGFSYALDGPYKTAWESTDNGTAEWSLGTSGDLYIKMNLTNKSGQSKTIYRQDFTLDLNGNTPGRTPISLYNAQKNLVSSVTIANNATATVYLYFQNIFVSISPASDWNNSNTNSSWSIDMARAGATLFGGDIFAHKNSIQGWYQR